MGDEVAAEALRQDRSETSVSGLVNDTSKPLQACCRSRSSKNKRDSTIHQAVIYVS